MRDKEIKEMVEMTKENYEQELAKRLEMKRPEAVPEAMGYLERQVESLQGISTGLADRISDIPLTQLGENMPKNSGILQYLVDRHVRDNHQDKSYDEVPLAKMIRQRDAIRWVVHAISADSTAFYENVGLTEAQRTIYHPGALYWFEDLFGYETAAEMEQRKGQSGNGQKPGRKLKVEIPFIDLTGEEQDIGSKIDEELKAAGVELLPRQGKPQTYETTSKS